MRTVDLVCLDIRQAFDIAQPESQRLRRDLTDVHRYLKGGCKNKQGQALLSGAQQQEQRHWLQTETQEVL